MGVHTAPEIESPARVAPDSLFAAHDEGPLAHIHEHPEIDAGDLDQVERMTPRPVRILDVGAGRGGFVLRARLRKFETYGLDIEPSASRIWQRTGVPAALGDAFAPPFRAETFDVVRLKE